MTKKFLFGILQIFFLLLYTTQIQAQSPKYPREFTIFSTDNQVKVVFDTKFGGAITQLYDSYNFGNQNLISNDSNGAMFQFNFWNNNQSPLASFNCPFKNDNPIQSGPEQWGESGNPIGYQGEISEGYNSYTICTNSGICLPEDNNEFIKNEDGGKTVHFKTRLINWNYCKQPGTGQPLPQTDRKLWDTGFYLEQWGYFHPQFPRTLVLKNKLSYEDSDYNSTMLNPQQIIFAINLPYFAYWKEGQKVIDGYIEKPGSTYVENYISSDRISNWARFCPVDSSGVRKDKCGPWTNFPLNNLRGVGNESYLSRSDLYFTENSQKKYFLGYISIDGRDSWGNYCTITEGNEFKCNQNDWFDVPSNPPVRNQSLFIVSEEGKLYQTLMAMDGRSNQFRDCTVDEAGIHWDKCSEWVIYDNTNIMGTGNESYSAQNEYIVSENGRRFLYQSLLNMPGTIEYIRKCPVYADGVHWNGNECSSWSQKSLSNLRGAGSETYTSISHGFLPYFDDEHPIDPDQYWAALIASDKEAGIGTATSNDIKLLKGQAPGKFGVTTTGQTPNRIESVLYPYTWVDLGTWGKITGVDYDGGITWSFHPGGTWEWTNYYPVGDLTMIKQSSEAILAQSQPTITPIPTPILPTPTDIPATPLPTPTSTPVPPSPTPTPLPGDITGPLRLGIPDGVVNIYDYNLLIGDFGKTNSPADIDGNGIVDIYDYNTLIGNFEKTNLL